MTPSTSTHRTVQRAAVAATAFVVTLLTLLATAGDVLACPVCNTDTGAAVRAGIFDERFLTTLLATLAPFPVFGAVVAALHFGWTPRRASRRLDDDGDLVSSEGRR